MRRVLVLAAALAGCSLRWPTGGLDGGSSPPQDIGGDDAPRQSDDRTVVGLDVLDSDAGIDVSSDEPRGGDAPPDRPVVQDALADEDGTVPPLDGATMCRACSATSPPEFCAGTGLGMCLAAVQCDAGCGVCAVPLRTGDRCGSDVFVMSTRGRSRYIFSTCRATDDLDIACGRSGPDIVLAFRVDIPGRVSFSFTVPRGVEVYVGYDPANGGTCRDTVTFGRVCAGNDPSNVRIVNSSVNRGTFYLYVMTNVEATVVVDAELP